LKIKCENCGEERPEVYVTEGEETEIPGKFLIIHYYLFIYLFIYYLILWIENFYFIILLFYSCFLFMFFIHFQNRK